MSHRYVRLGPIIRELLDGLLQHEQLSVHVLESAAACDEGGAAIRIAVNALTAAINLLGLQWYSV